MDEQKQNLKNNALTVRGVSKKFCGRNRRSMFYGLKDLGYSLFRRKHDTSKLRRDEFWAVQNITFDVAHGETVAVLGDNGSGKSTLCRLIAGILPLDTGEIHVEGRVGALMSLGVGFHSCMTGRENIFLNGAILGMTKDVITERVSDIAAFSELGEAIDMPVSTYSSGMKTRLGFSVAAHSDVDMLVIDEVLAVGDVAFRNKCLQYLQRSHARRTLIIVSHNITQINALCERALFLRKGKLCMDGPVDEVVAAYLDHSGRTIVRRENQIVGFDVPGHEFHDGRVFFLSAGMKNSAGACVDHIRYGERAVFSIRVKHTIDLVRPLITVWFMYFVTRQRVAFDRVEMTRDLSSGILAIEFSMPQMLLQPGQYLLGAGVGDLDTKEKLAVSNDLFLFSVSPLPDQAPKSTGLGYVRIQGEWRCEDACGEIYSSPDFLPFGNVLAPLT